MTKLRLLHFSLMLFVIAAMSMPALGTSVEVQLGMGDHGSAGVSPAQNIGAAAEAESTLAYLSIDSSAVSLPSGRWRLEVQTAGATSIVTDDTYYDLWPGDNAYLAVYAPGGHMAVIEGSGSGAPFMIATFVTAQTQSVPTQKGEDNPDALMFFDGTFNVTYLDPSFFPGEGCSGVCGTGSIYVEQSNLLTDASLTTYVTFDPPTDPSPEPSSFVLLLLGAAFIPQIIKKRGKDCRRPCDSST